MVKIDNNLKQLIENNPMSLATINNDNTPNVIGVAFVKIISENQIVITDNYMSQTINNIQNNNNVCLAVWDKDWEGRKLIGTADYYTSGEWKTFVENIKENKGQAAKGAIVVTINKIIKLY